MSCSKFCCKQEWGVTLHVSCVLYLGNRTEYIYLYLLSHILSELTEIAKVLKRPEEQTREYMEVLLCLYKSVVLRRAILDQNIGSSCSCCKESHGQCFLERQTNFWDLNTE